MPDYVLEVPRHFTPGQRDALTDKGIQVREPVVLSADPQSSTIGVTADDAGAARQFVIEELDLSPGEAEQVNVISPSEAVSENDPDPLGVSEMQRAVDQNFRN